MYKDDPNSQKTTHLEMLNTTFKTKHLAENTQIIINSS